MLILLLLFLIVVKASSGITIDGIEVVVVSHPTIDLRNNLGEIGSTFLVLSWGFRLHRVWKSGAWPTA